MQTEFDSLDIFYFFIMLWYFYLLTCLPLFLVPITTIVWIMWGIAIVTNQLELH